MRHGEYKTPGGKLVIVDFEVDGGKLSNVEVTGDFFLYPEEGLSTIVGAINGLPATSSADDIARAINQAIDPDTELVGFSPEAIAIAVERGLES